MIQGLHAVKVKTLQGSPCSEAASKADVSAVWYLSRLDHSFIRLLGTKKHLKQFSQVSLIKSNRGVRGCHGSEELCPFRINIKH
ncbi:hypothetical protein PoB_001718100 [Plakobranchus ocellatus]|uniref:Uncharacterized protein n=1 Tax=Plakobranchus ocellatus TaxID=259542 RepID=A0AAV3Z492_9GAST|nr:hypothetical protein PoB_001718100 [Plakobranchus ocellatus]